MYAGDKKRIEKDGEKPTNEEEEEQEERLERRDPEEFFRVFICSPTDLNTCGFVQKNSTNL